MQKDVDSNDNDGSSVDGAVGGHDSNDDDDDDQDEDQDDFDYDDDDELYGEDQDLKDRYIESYIHAYTHTYIHTYTHICMRTF